MTIAPTLKRCLADENIRYEAIPHQPTMSSMRTAEACSISGDRIAKGIVLRRNGGYMLAVLPASHHIRLAELKQQLGSDVELADEDEIDGLLHGCARGAVPPVGRAFGLKTIVDDSLRTQPDIYAEAGDHETLLHMSQAEFARLTGDAAHGRFSVHD